MGPRFVMSALEDVQRGWNPNFNAGTRADFYVAKTGSDANPGTFAAPFLTIGAAMAAAAAAGPNKTIAIRAGDYREAVLPTTAHAGLTLKGYGSEKPRIWGGRPLTGWTQCSAADEPALGPVLGVASSPVWKVTVAASSIVHPGSLCLYEGDAFVPICQQQTTDLDWYSYFPYYETSDSLTKNGSNQLLTITDASVLSGLDTAKLVGRAFVYVNYGANLIGSMQITAHSGNTITVAGLLSVGTNTTVAWNLANYLPKLTPGTYGYIDNGNSTWTIYVYPNDPANLTAGMSCAERSSLFVFDSVSGIRLIGLQLEQIGTVDAMGRLLSVNQNNGAAISGFEMRHCRLRKFHSGVLLTNGSLRSSPVRFWRTNDLVINRCTFEDFFEGFGAEPTGTKASGGGTGARITQNVFRRIASAAVRAFRQDDIWVCFNDLIGVGRGGHANLTNFYTGCDRFIFWGNRIRDTYAYFTWQDASRFVVAFNDFETSKLNGEAIRDQNDGGTIPVFPSKSYVFNNLIVPSSLTWTLSVQLGEPYDLNEAGPIQPENHGYHLVNNVIHGGGVEEPYRVYTAPRTNWRTQPGFDDTQIERQREGNIYTELAFWQTPAFGWSARESETVEENLAFVYENVGAQDYRAVPGSPILTAPPASIAEIITECQALFPGFNFGRDASGRPFNPFVLERVGPYQHDFNTQVQWLQAQVPETLSSNSWFLMTEGAEVNVVVTALPNDGGSPITAFEESINGGAWVSLGASGRGRYVSSAVAGDTVRLRAVNAVGQASPSASKAVDAGLSISSVTTSTDTVNDRGMLEMAITSPAHLAGYDAGEGLPGLFTFRPADAMAAPVVLYPGALSMSVPYSGGILSLANPPFVAGVGPIGIGYRVIFGGSEVAASLPYATVQAAGSILTVVADVTAGEVTRTVEVGRITIEENPLGPQLSSFVVNYDTNSISFASDVGATVRWNRFPPGHVFVNEAQEVWDGTGAISGGEFSAVAGPNVFSLVATGGISGLQEIRFVARVGSGPLSSPIGGQIDANVPSGGTLTAPNYRASTIGGNGLSVGVASVSIPLPPHNAGDLVLLPIGIDCRASFIAGLSATGPNGEAAIVKQALVDNEEGGNSAASIALLYYRAAAANVDGSVTINITPGGYKSVEQIICAPIIRFDAKGSGDPFAQVLRSFSVTAVDNVTTAALTAISAASRIEAAFVNDSTLPPIDVPDGWFLRERGLIGPQAMKLISRNAATTAAGQVIAPVSMPLGTPQRWVGLIWELLPKGA